MSYHNWIYTWGLFLGYYILASASRKIWEAKIDWRLSRKTPTLNVCYQNSPPSQQKILIPSDCAHWNLLNFKFTEFRCFSITTAALLAALCLSYQIAHTQHDKVFFVCAVLEQEKILYTFCCPLSVERRAHNRLEVDFFLVFRALSGTCENLGLFRLDANWEFPISSGSLFH
jgi:hypothetical protein